MSEITHEWMYCFQCYMSHYFERVTSGWRCPNCHAIRDTLPRPAHYDSTCPFCAALNRIDATGGNNHTHPEHLTSMGARCAASGLTVAQAIEAAKHLPVMDAPAPAGEERKP